MITDYMENLKVENPFTHLKPWQKTPYEKQNGKYIYKNGHGSYLVQKSVQGKTKTFGTFQNFPEAVKFREELIKNDWEPLNPEEDEKKEYFKNVYINSRHYHVSKNGQFYGSVQTLEEALYFRDICRDHDWDYNVKPRDLDLITDNPYLKDGLKYPIPERLLLEKPETDYGKGQIRKKGPQSYHIYYGSKGNGKTDYICACRTYEQAYYVKQEMNKVDWDKSKLGRILDNYPVWYTWLLNLYKYIQPIDSKKGTRYKIRITPKHSKTGKLDHISSFSNLEDALYERDLLVKYDFDEDLITELWNPDDNPYYNMELPPYPTRQIRMIKDREDRSTLFDDLYEILNNYPDISQEELCELCCVSVVTLRNILKNEFDMTLPDFINLCKSGEHPNEVLEQKPLIYTPDLEIHTGASYIAYYPDRRSPYVITKWFDGKNHYFGEYPTEELAKKIIKDLKKCGWDKSQLRKIQAKHGHVPMMGKKRWVYENKRTSKRTGKVKVYSYSVRHKDKDKRMIGYGTYKDKRVAELVRDLLILYDWDKAELCWIQDLATYTIEQADNNWRCRL